MNNAGVIFKRAVRDSRLGILGWGIGMGLMMTMIVQDLLTRLYTKTPMLR